MDVRVRLEQPDVDAMIELQNWLDGRHRGTEVDSGQTTGDMSGTLEWIQFAVETSLALGQLVVAIAAWRQSRPDKPNVLLTTTTADGVEVRVESDDPEAVAAAVRALGEP